MTVLSLVATLLLTQAEVAAPAAPASPDANVSAAERAAAAAEKAAAAAEKAAAAAQRIAEAQFGPVAPAAAAPAAAPEAEHWKGLIGVGLVALSGTSETLTGTASLQLDRKFGEWAFGARAGGAYGQTRDTTGADQVTALRAGLLLRVDRSVASFATLYALAGTEADHVKSVELRAFGELGTGLKFYERKEGDLEKVYLRGDVAFRYSRESRFQYYASSTLAADTGLPAVTLVAPRLGAVFRYAVNKEIRFSEEAECLPNLIGASRVLVNSTTKLNARLTEALSISASFLVNFDSSPAGSAKSTDTALTLGLEAAF